jgi:hypothetical protein
MDKNATRVIAELSSGRSEEEIIDRISRFTCTEEIECLIFEYPEVGKQVLMTMLALSIAISSKDEEVTFTALGSNAETSLALSKRLLPLAGYTTALSENKYEKLGRPTINLFSISHTHGIAPNLHALHEQYPNAPEFIIISQPRTVNRVKIHDECITDNWSNVRTFDAIGLDIIYPFVELYRNVYDKLSLMGELDDSFFDKMQEFLLLALAKIDHKNGTAVTSLAITIREILKRVFPHIVNHIE